MADDDDWGHLGRASWEYNKGITERFKDYREILVGIVEFGHTGEEFARLRKLSIKKYRGPRSGPWMTFGDCRGLIFTEGFR